MHETRTFRLMRVLNRAGFGKERVILKCRGKAIVSVIPLENLALLQSLQDKPDGECAG